MKKILYIVAAICGLAAATVPYQIIKGERESTAEYWITCLLLALVCALCILVIRKTNRKKTGAKKKAQTPKQPQKPTAAPTPQPAPAPAAPERTEPSQPTAPAAPKKYRTVYEGKVVGVSFKGRQNVLARIKRGEEDGDSVLYTLEAGEYQGRPCIKVLAELMSEEKPARQIGFIAEADIPKVMPYIDSGYAAGEIYGGPEDEYDDSGKNYGCALEVFIEEK